MPHTRGMGNAPYPLSLFGGVYDRLCISDRYLCADQRRFLGGIRPAAAGVFMTATLLAVVAGLFLYLPQVQTILRVRYRYDKVSRYGGHCPGLPVHLVLVSCLMVWVVMRLLRWLFPSVSAAGRAGEEAEEDQEGHRRGRGRKRNTDRSSLPGVRSGKCVTKENPPPRRGIRDQSFTLSSSLQNASTAALIRFSC